MSKKFICVAKCPELDSENSKHCIATDEDIAEKSGDYCPCGNVEKWEELISNDDNTEQEQATNDGLVMIDEEYYFKIQARQYVFGRVRTIQDGESKNYGKPIYNDMLFPNDIQGVFKLYFKHKLADLTAGKKLEIQELLKVVEEIKAIILDISKKLQVEG